MKLVPIVAAIVAISFLLPAGAKPDDTAAVCKPTDSEPLFERDGFYLVADLTGVYLYEEDNPRPGLQRMDAGRDDTCKGIHQPDRLVL